MRIGWDGQSVYPDPDERYIGAAERKDGSSVVFLFRGG